MAKRADQANNSQKCWLVKTEPECFSIDELAQAPQQTTCWDGVRNYQARNFLRDEMKLGHRVLIYHSSADPPAIVGTATIVREAYPDHTACDPNSDHFDPASTADNPRWFMVDIRLECAFHAPLPLPSLRSVAALKHMELLRKGSRLSVQPVTPGEFAAVLKLAERRADDAIHPPQIPAQSPASTSSGRPGSGSDRRRRARRSSRS